MGGRAVPHAHTYTNNCTRWASTSTNVSRPIPRPPAIPGGVNPSCRVNPNPSTSTKVSRPIPPPACYPPFPPPLQMVER